MELDFGNAKREIIDRHIINQLKTATDVIIFGAGGSGDWTADVLRKNDITPRCYCDNSVRKQGKVHNSLDVLSFESAISRYPKASICVASMWQEEILKQIIAYDPKLEERTYNLLLTMAWETTNHIFVSSEETYIKDKLLCFEKLYHDLADEISKKTLRGILNYRLTRNKNYLDEIKSSENIYMDDTIWRGFAPNENFYIIDGGAYDGDSAEEFIEKWGDQATLHLYCFEASRANCHFIEDKQALFYPHRIFVHNSALWDISGCELVFSDSCLSGKITEKGSKCVVTEKIDDIDFERVDFIKLDIEGAERNCLEGARKTIEKYHPRLAICAYHLQDDLLVLYEFIKSLHGSYDIKLRHYKDSSGDTILYGIPPK